MEIYKIFFPVVICGEIAASSRATFQFLDEFSPDGTKKGRPASSCGK